MARRRIHLDEPAYLNANNIPERFFGIATPEVTDNNIYQSRIGMLPEVSVTAKGDPRKVNNEYYKAHSKARADLQSKVQTAPGWQLAALGAALPATFMLAPTVVSAVGRSLANPLVDAALTTHGAITAPKNISQGVNEIKEGNYAEGASNLGLTVLDLLGAGNLIGRSARMMSKPYRAKHAYNTIIPVSYSQEAPKVLKEYLKYLWNNPSINYKKPKWYKKASENLNNVEEGVTNTVGYLPASVKNRNKITDEARIDAWAIYNGLPQQYGTYLKNTDGSYRYNLNKILRDSENTWFPELDFSIGNGRKADFVTGSHGGLFRSENIFEDNVGNDIWRIEDLWDVQPMKGHVGGKSFSSRFIQPKLHRLFNFGTSLRHAGQKVGYDTVPIGGEEFELIEKDNSILRNIGVYLDNAGKFITQKASTNGKIRNALDKKFKNFELSMLTGGQPFFMKTNIPYHRDAPFNGQVVSSRVYDDFEKRGFKFQPKYGFNDLYYHPMSNTDAELFGLNIKGKRRLKDGGRIYIKPENRGKFTALKERTGHSASWFKENGTPAQKKMAIFALNSRKWKH